MDQWMIDPKEDIIYREPVPTQNTYSYWIYIFIIFVGVIVFYLVYYAVKYNTHKSNYLIPSNATNYKIYLANIIEDIQNTWKNTIEKWKEYRERYLFESHITNGVFHKSKATDFVHSLMSSSSSSSTFRKNE